jgi:hypothetical protein
MTATALDTQTQANGGTLILVPQLPQRAGGLSFAQRDARRGDAREAQSPRQPGSRNLCSSCAFQSAFHRQNFRYSAPQLAGDEEVPVAVVKTPEVVSESAGAHCVLTEPRAQQLARGVKILRQHLLTSEQIPGDDLHLPGAGNDRNVVDAEDTARNVDARLQRTVDEYVQREIEILVAKLRV